MVNFLRIYLWNQSKNKYLLFTYICNKNNFSMRSYPIEKQTLNKNFKYFLEKEN